MLIQPDAGCIDASDPQPAHKALAVSAIAIRVSQRLEHGFVCTAIEEPLVPLWPSVRFNTFLCLACAGTPRFTLGNCFLQLESGRSLPGYAYGSILRMRGASTGLTTCISSYCALARGDLRVLRWLLPPLVQVNSPVPVMPNRLAAVLLVLILGTKLTPYIEIHRSSALAGQRQQARPGPRGLAPPGLSGNRPGRGGRLHSHGPRRRLDADGTQDQERFLPSMRGARSTRPASPEAGSDLFGG